MADSNEAWLLKWRSEKKVDAADQRSLLLDEIDFKLNPSNMNLVVFWCERQNGILLNLFREDCV